MLVTVFVSHHDVDLIPEHFRQLFVNQSHLKALVHHLVTIKLKPEEPRALGCFSCQVIDLDIVVELHKNLIFWNYSLFRIRVVENS